MVVAPANTHDAEPVNDLLAGRPDDEHKAAVFADSAYAGADTAADLGWRPDDAPSDLDRVPVQICDVGVVDSWRVLAAIA